MTNEKRDGQSPKTAHQATYGDKASAGYKSLVRSFALIRSICDPVEQEYELIIRAQHHKELTTTQFKTLYAKWGELQDNNPHLKADSSNFKEVAPGLKEVTA